MADKDYENDDVDDEYHDNTTRTTVHDDDTTATCNNTNVNINDNELFIKYHQEQLKTLNIPSPLYDGLQYQLEQIFSLCTNTGNKNKTNSFDNSYDDTNIDSNDEKKPIKFCIERVSTFMGKYISSLSSTESSVAGICNDETNNVSLLLRPGQALSQLSQQSQQRILLDNPYGTILVIPHICSWDMTSASYQLQLINTIQQLPFLVLRTIINGLDTVAAEAACSTKNVFYHNQQQQQEEEEPDKESSINDIDKITELVHKIVDHTMFWSCVILYHDQNTKNYCTDRKSNGSNSVRGALPAPPYYPHYNIDKHKIDNCIESEDEEADITGPFPFQYQRNTNDSTQATINVSLGYISPNVLRCRVVKQQRLPTIDLVPSYQYPNNPLLRAVRYILLTEGGKCFKHTNEYVQLVNEYYATFVHSMHLVRQSKILNDKEQKPDSALCLAATTTDNVNKNMQSETNFYNIDTEQQQKQHEMRTRLKVYTDCNDPMELAHPITGLEANSQYFTMVSDPFDADIVFSYQSLFSKNNNSSASKTTPLFRLLQKRKQQQQQQNLLHAQETNIVNATTNVDTANQLTLFINQFPYEGAFVQKDHLAREVYNQHGLPRPYWSIESYDLDVHLPYFAGSILTSQQHQNAGNDCYYYGEEEGDEDSKIINNNNNNQTKEQQQQKGAVWIVKPSNGTQSKGHIVTRSLAHIVRLIDSRGTNVVVQKYIENPVCYNGRKVDCRIIVLMVPPSLSSSSIATTTTATGSTTTTPSSTTTATGSTPSTTTNHQRPLLYMHNTVYFRIAHKVHTITNEYNLCDHESVLTATHLFNDTIRTSDDTIDKLPHYQDTINRLEAIYGENTFDWYNKILPQIQCMICELFNGMTSSYPAMMESTCSRAMYGVDVMFEINDSLDDDDDNEDNSTTTEDDEHINKKNYTGTYYDNGDDDEQQQQQNHPSQENNKSFNAKRRMCSRTVTPKLLEVTFCPANNAICDAYERDEHLYKSYNKDIFEALFLGIISDSITQLQ